MAVKKSNKLALPQPAAFKQILKRCSSLGKKNSSDRDDHPSDVPKGHFVVYVGENRSRYIIPVSWCSHPLFQNLLQKSEEAYGYKQDMGITIPCDEHAFLSVASKIR